MGTGRRIGLVLGGIALLLVLGGAGYAFFFPMDCDGAPNPLGCEAAEYSDRADILGFVLMFALLLVVSAGVLLMMERRKEKAAAPPPPPDPRARPPSVQVRRR